LHIQFAGTGDDDYSYLPTIVGKSGAQTADEVLDGINLRNPRNDCFMNSALQALLWNPQFMRYFSKEKLEEIFRNMIADAKMTHIYLFRAIETDEHLSGDIPKKKSLTNYIQNGRRFEGSTEKQFDDLWPFLPATTQVEFTAKWAPLDADQQKKLSERITIKLRDVQPIAQGNLDALLEGLEERAEELRQQDERENSRKKLWNKYLVESANIVAEESIGRPAKQVTAAIFLVFLYRYQSGYLDRRLLHLLYHDYVRYFDMIFPL
jgi:hypothetical protein